MPRSLTVTLPGFLLATSLLYPVTAFAQDQAEEVDDATTLGTIVLNTINDGGTGVSPTEAANTAGSRVPVNPNELPRSLTILPRELFEAQGARTLEEAAAYSPGITTETYGQDNRYDEFTLRGFESQDSVYRDGMPLRTVDWAAWRTEPFGLESINILRGPTSDLYGANRPGGLINAVTKRPRFTFGGEVRAVLTDEGGREVGVDVTGPLSDTVAYRFVGLFNQSGTNYDEVDTDRLYLAPSITFAPSDDTTLTLYAQYQKDDVGDTYVLVPRFGSLEPNANGPFGPDTYTGNPDYNDIETTQGYVGYELDQRLTGSLRFMSRARYSENDWENRTEYPGAFVNLSYLLGAPSGLPQDVDTALMTRFDVDQEMTQISVDNALVYEFNTASARGHLAFGVDYYGLESETDFSFAYAGIRDLRTGAAMNLPLPGVPALLDNRRETDIDQTGLYINGHADIGTRMIVSGSVRHDWVDFETSGFSTSLQTGAREPFNTQLDDRFTSGSLALGYKLTPDLMAYGSASKGFNLPPSGVGIGNVPLDVEESDSYELGLKFLSGNGNTAVNFAVFNIERENLSLASAVQPGFFEQIGKARSRGAELEVTHDFQNGLSLFASASYTDATVTEDSRPEGTSLAGNRLARAPKVTAALFAQYEFANIPGLAIGAGVRFAGDRYADDQNTLKVGSTTLYDASISYHRNEWDVLLAARNLTNKQQVSFCGTSQLPLGALDQFSGSCVYSAGREVSLTVRRNF